MIRKGGLDLFIYETGFLFFPTVAICLGSIYDLTNPLDALKVVVLLLVTGLFVVSLLVYHQYDEIIRS